FSKKREESSGPGCLQIGGWREIRFSFCNSDGRDHLNQKLVQCLAILWVGRDTKSQNSDSVVRLLRNPCLKFDAIQVNRRRVRQVQSVAAMREAQFAQINLPKLDSWLALRVHSGRLRVERDLETPFLYTHSCVDFR